MEQYANNLESLVEERTQSYLEEKEKCKDSIQKLMKIIITQGKAEMSSLASQSSIQEIQFKPSWLACGRRRRQLIISRFGCTI